MEIRTRSYDDKNTDLWRQIHELMGASANHLIYKPLKASPLLGAATEGNVEGNDGFGGGVHVHGFV